MLERAHLMDRLLKDINTHYVLVVRPTTTSVQDSSQVQTELKKRKIVIGQVVINQVMPDVTIFDQEFKLIKELDYSPDEREELTEALTMYMNTVTHEANLIERLQRDFGKEHSHVLYLSNNKDRASLITQMLQDYERITT